ncbi:cell cycle regulator of non-homologous end joining isoform X2 [Melospiza melodia melodia]|uniref:cell cycle regulator of non-homologous end joining isoform X2 n=1 Tax=Melospiza melodia melodia TaxID=1914991 RepID=UPI002FD665EB
MAFPASPLCPSGAAAFAKQNRGPGAWRGVAHGHGGLPSCSLGAPAVKSCTAGPCCFPSGQNLQSEEGEEKARSGSEEEQEIPPTPQEEKRAQWGGCLLPRPWERREEGLEGAVQPSAVSVPCVAGRIPRKARGKGRRAWTDKRRHSGFCEDPFGGLVLGMESQLQRGLAGCSHWAWG